MEQTTIHELICNGQLHLGMAKAEVRALLGPPQAWGNTSRSYREPSIWKYGDIELWFEQRKGRTPWPGPKLTRVYTEDVKGNGMILLG